MIDFKTSAEIAKQYKCTVGTINRYRRENGLPGFKAGFQKEWRYDPVEVQRWFVRNGRSL